MLCVAGGSVGLDSETTDRFGKAPTYFGIPFSNTEKPEELGNLIFVYLCV